MADDLACQEDRRQGTATHFAGYRDTSPSHQLRSWMLKLHFLEEQSGSLGHQDDLLPVGNDELVQAPGTVAGAYQLEHQLDGCTDVLLRRLAA